MISNVLNRATLTWTASILGALLAVYTIVGLFWVPSYLDTRLTDIAGKQYGLTMNTETSSFNPFTFRYEIDQLRLNRGDSTVFSAKTISVNFDPFVSIFARQYTFGNIGIDSLKLRIRRDQTGRLNWQEILTRAEVDPETVQQSLESKWGVSIDYFRVSGSSVSWEDQRLETDSAINIRNLDFTGQTLNYPLRGQSPFDLHLSIGGGEFRAEGSIEGDRTYFTNYSLEGFSLPILNDLLPPNVPGHFTGGQLAVQGQLRGQLDGTGSVLQSSGSVQNLRLVDDRQRPMIGVGSLAMDTSQLTLDEPRLEVTKITVDSPVLHLIRGPGGKLNIHRLFNTPGDTIPADTGLTNPKRWSLKLGPTQVRSGQFTFLDRALGEDVRIRIDDISGTSGVVSSVPGDTTSIEVRAMVAGEAPVRGRATVSPREPEQTMDLAGQLRELSLSPFSPYSTKYIGYRIDGGKLKLTLDYTIRDGLLGGSNEIVLNRFTLGKRVNDSPVISAPVKLGVALLKDRNGQIKISIPVEGNLLKPEFQLQQTINQAIGNSVGMVVSSPFNFLAGMVGARAEELRTIDFDPGTHELGEASTSNLEKLAEALRKRPLLQLEIRPVWSKADQRFFASKTLDRRLKQNGGTPDNLVGSRQSLEQLFDREFSSQQRHRLLDQHTHQAEGSFSKELEREAYVNQLYERLLEATSVESQTLNELATLRATAIRSGLVSRNISPERLYVLDRKRIDSDDLPVSLPLDLSPGS